MPVLFQYRSVVVKYFIKKDMFTGLKRCGLSPDPVSFYLQYASANIVGSFYKIYFRLLNLQCLYCRKVKTSG